MVKSTNGYITILMVNGYPIIEISDVHIMICHQSMAGWIGPAIDSVLNLAPWDQSPGILAQNEIKWTDLPLR